MIQQNDRQQPPEGPSPLRLVGIGSELVAFMVLGVALGWWLDRRFGSEPWLLLGGSLLGAVTGMFNFIRRVTTSGRSGTGTS